MSVTTTASTIRPQEILSALGDYELHHSGGPGSPESHAPPPNPRPELAASDQAPRPASWPTQYRDVPPYRPINRELDREQRPGGMNAIEQVFIATLLNGSGLNATLSQLWRKTGAKVLGTKIFHYEVGGEW